MLPCALVAMAVASPLGVATASANGCAGENDLPTAVNVPQMRRATLCLLNQERTSRGLPKLHSHPALATAARRYAKLMVAESFFDHVSPSGSTMVKRIKATSYLSHAGGWAVGENLAWGGGPQASPAAIMVAWMASPGHRQNILDRRFREIGIGLVVGTPVAEIGANGGTYVTEFGQRSR
jgi:uncharacterized protein YkwD